MTTDIPAAERRALASRKLDDLPYPPSWVDRLTAWVDRLPVPAWLFYVILAVVSILLTAAIQWREGAYPVGTFYSLHVFIVVQGAYALALMHYLDRKALDAVEDFRPALTAGDADYAEICYELTTLPARPTAIAGLLGSAFAAALVALLIRPFLPITRTAPTALSIGSLVLAVVLIWWVYGALIYHTLHQLRVVNAIYTRHTRIDLFRLDPLYALSNFTARTGVGLMVLNILWILLVPEVMTNPVAILPWVLFFLAIGAAFFWPLMGVHRLLEKEKGRLLAEASQRLKGGILELHRRMDQGEFQEMDGLNKALASLEIEHQALKRIPTWPWQPGTLRGFLGALFLPIVIWLIQFFLLTYLSP